MNCVACGADLVADESIKFGICLECRLFPEPGRVPLSDEEHDETVVFVRNFMSNKVTSFFGLGK